MRKDADHPRPPPNAPIQPLEQGCGLKVVSIVPTAAQKAGDFATINIFDPLTNASEPSSAGLFTGTRIPDNRIPESRVPRPARLLAHLYPDPTAALISISFHPTGSSVTIAPRPLCPT